jgi:predicted RNase H-like nuclease
MAFHPLAAGQIRQGHPCAWPQRPETWKFVALRRFEDAIDALVCAWMAAEFWSGRARAVGDANAPIWIPHLRDSDR